MYTMTSSGFGMAGTVLHMVSQTLVTCVVFYQRISDQFHQDNKMYNVGLSIVIPKSNLTFARN